MSPMLFQAGNHSKLLPITWQGKGTAEVESLLSVFRRMAFSHRVTPGVLFNMHFKYIVERSGISGENNRLKRSKVGSIAGDGIILRCVAEQIAQLTGELDATSASLIRLASLLCSRGLASPVSRFCPYCLMAGPDAMYGRALWDFAAVSACPMHGTYLVEPVCGSPQSQRVRATRAVHLSGLCPRCGMKRMRCQLGCPAVADRGAVRAAEEVGDLIAHASGGGDLDAATLREGIAQCIEITDRRRNRDLIRLGLTCAYIRDWTKGLSKPTLQGLLALSSEAGIRLLDVFQANVAKLSRQSSFHYHYEGVTTAGRRVLPRSKKNVQTELKLLIQEEGIEHVSGLRLAQRLGVSTRHLRKNFPQVWAECQRVREDNRRIRTVKRQSELEGLIHVAIKQLRRVGYAPTAGKVFDFMRPIPQRYGTREVSLSIKKCLKELGL